jgi:hypothetical protein
MFWYPRHGNSRMHEVLHSEWGRLFYNWEKLTPDEQGWPDVGQAPAELVRNTLQLVRMGAGILGTCIMEAPETRKLRRRKVAVTN